VSGNHGHGDAWIVRLDVSGNIQWQKCFGGSKWETASSIQQTTDGGFIFVGSSESNDGDVSGNHGDYDAWVVKIDSAGNLEWQKCLGGSDGDGAFSVQQTITGEFIVAGNSFSNDGDATFNHFDGNGNHTSDYWIVKLDPAGNIIWQRSLGGSESDYPKSIQQTFDGGFIVAGYSESNDGDVSGNPDGEDYWIVKLSSDGNIEWQKCLGGDYSDIAFSIEPSTDGGFVVAGASDSKDGNVIGNHGFYDFWIVKLSCNVSQFFYSDQDGDGYGNANVSIAGPACFPPAGYVYDSTDCDDTNASINPTATEICNGIDDNCNFTADEGFPFITYFADADIDGFGNVADFIDSCTQPAGYISDSTDCDDTNPNVNPGAIEILGNGIDDNCDGYIDEFGVGIFSFVKNENQLSVFPNPTDGKFLIEFKCNEKVTSIVTIEVLNQLGEVVLSQNAEIVKGRLQQEIVLNKTPVGIYLMKMIVSDKVITTQINLQK